MRIPNKILILIGCLLLAYAIVATSQHWEANKLSAELATTFFIFALIRWIGRLSGSRKM